MKRPPSTPVRYALHVSAPHKRWMLGAFAAVSAAEAQDALQLWVFKLMTDSFVTASTSGEFDATWKLAVLYAALYFTLQSTWRISGFCGMRWNTGLESESYRTLFSYLTGHSATYFNNRFAGALTNKVSNATRGVRSIAGKVLWEFYPLLFGFCTYAYLAYTANALLAAVLTIWMALFMAINVLLAMRKRPLAYKYAEASSDLKGKMVDSTGNIAAVQQAGHFRFEKEYVGEYIESQRAAHLRSWWYSEWILFLNGTLLALICVIMLWLSIGMLRRGDISVGTAVMLIGIVVSLQRSLFFIGQRLAETMDDYGLIKEGLEDLLLPHDITDAPNATALKVTGGEIQWQSVNFRYGAKQVFSDFTLRIPAGQKVGLVGYSGAGKSTFVQLMLRNYDLAGGRIEIDGQRIDGVTIESLRSSMAVVPQEPSLFHRSVMENIRYGKLDASDAEVIEAAKKAQADEFINELPQGYETFVGERGVKLSGGQRQRIAIARAIVRNAPILILDEATSSLDSESERLIQQALTELMRGKTVIAIAHRLSTLRSMDRLIVLNEGSVTEDGTHDELLRNGGIYAELWNSQVGGMIQTSPASPAESH